MFDFLLSYKELSVLFCCVFITHRRQSLLEEEYDEDQVSKSEWQGEQCWSSEPVRAQVSRLSPPGEPSPNNRAHNEPHRERYPNERLQDKTFIFITPNEYEIEWLLLVKV